MNVAAILHAESPDLIKLQSGDKIGDIPRVIVRAEILQAGDIDSSLKN